MRFRKREHDDKPEPATDQQIADPDDSHLQNLRSEGECFLAAGDEAIKNALSKGNSETFLAANKQAGGQ